jgi:transposase
MADAGHESRRLAS